MKRNYNELIGMTEVDRPKLGEGQMKIFSWNVTGWKAMMKKGLEEYLQLEGSPVIVCIQETRVAPEQAPPVPEGYHHYHFTAADSVGYSGVGILSKVKPINWTNGFAKEYDKEGRVITAEYEKFYLVNAYVPTAGNKLKYLDYRKKWDKEFHAYLRDLDKKKPVILCGDLNVASQDIDLKNPDKNRNKTEAFTDAERGAFHSLLESGFVDTFRHFYPDAEGAYTFWRRFMNSRERNVGWRLDYIVISSSLMDKLKASYIRIFTQGSDHAPVAIHLDNLFKEEENVSS